MYTQPKVSLLAQLTALVGMSGYFNGCHIFFFGNDITPTPGTALADLIELVATGYADAAVTWDTPALNPDGEAEVFGQLFEVIFTNGESEAPTVYGYYLVDSGGTNLLLSERFEQPVVISYDGQPLRVLPTLKLSQ